MDHCQRRNEEHIVETIIPKGHCQRRNEEHIVETIIPNLDILFEDFHYIAVNKPAPLLTQAPEGIPSLEGWVKQYIKIKYQKPAGVYLGIPHRLDRPVSGVTIFARNTKAASKLAIQFQNHTIQKVYWAIVQGKPVSPEGVWQDWLLKLPEESRAVVVEAQTEKAKEAITHYRLLASHEQHSLLELRPKTGRMHQLRLQASTRGLPILGDDMYGGPLPFGPHADLYRDRVIALHARELNWFHPFRKVDITLQASPPKYWPQWIHSLGS